MSLLAGFLWTLMALLSFWRRNLVSFFTLLAGLAIATALWSGVQALNSEARSSYDQAAQTLGGDQFRRIVPVGLETMPQGDFGDLRRAGWKVSPVLEGRIRLDGRRFGIIGIDPLTLPTSDRSANRWLEAFEQGNADLRAFLVPPFRAFVSGATFSEFGWKQGERPKTNESELPPLQVLNSLPPRTFLTDIGIAQKILGLEDRVSYLIVHDEQLNDTSGLQAALGDQFDVRQPRSDGELESLTDSFHLNLTAFGFLSFVVGLFIVNSAVGLAFEKRRGLVRTLRACGVSARQVGIALIVELLAIALLSGLIGIVGGYVIASALLPDVSASLEGLYGARVAGTLTLQWSWWLIGLTMAISGALLATGANLLRLTRLPILASANPLAWRQSTERTRIWQVAFAVGLGLAAITLLLVGNSLVVGFALMGCVLIGAALLLPATLALGIKACERLAQRPISQWFWADSLQQLSGLSLALMALLLALSINIGVGTMVQSFRLTFFNWLDQRLAAEIYLNAETAEQTESVLTYLRQEQSVTAVLPIWNGDTNYRGLPTEVFGIVDHATYRENWPLIEQTIDVWDQIARGEGVLVSEQIAREYELWLDERFVVESNQGLLDLPVVGVYSDYGNTIGQAVVSNEVLLQFWPNVERTRFGLRVASGDVDRVYDELSERFSFEGTSLIDQSALKALSRSVFERTFTVTIALNALTLAVAGVAMLTSLLTLAQMRLPQLAPVWALGLTRSALSRIEILRALALALLTAALALPLGLLIAWILLAVINVEAFGWRLPMRLFPADWIRLAAMAILTALLASAYPAFRLWRSPPSAFLRIFANER